MTKAEKMAEEWWKKGTAEYDLPLFSYKAYEMLKQLICQVAKRTRKECIGHARSDMQYILTDLESNEMAKTIRNAQWEEEEALDKK